MQALRNRIEYRIRRLVALVYAAVAMLAPAVAGFMLSPVGAEVALANAPGEVASARLSGIPFGGLISNRWPVVFQVSRDGRQLQRAVGAIELKCSGGGTAVFPDSWTRVPLNRGGRFNATYRDAFQEGAERIEIDDSLRGKVNRARTRITGTWRNRMTVQLADGSRETCDSGNLKFIAQR